MRTIRLVIISFIVLVTISCLTQQAVVGRYTLPDRDKTVQYIDNLIDSYNLPVNEYDKPRSDFDSIKAHFSLYHEMGSSFKVIVVETEPSFAPYIQFLSLIFISFRADQPIVIMDYNDTFGSLFPATEIVQGDWYIQENIPFTYNDTAIRQDFIFVVEATDISGDYMTTSHNAAQYIYQQDEKQLQLPRVSQTQTVTISRTQITNIQSSQNAIDEILSNPLSLPLSIAGILAVLFLVVIPAIFGSDIDFVKFIFIKRERDRILRDFKKSAREDKVKKQEKKD